MYITAGNYLGRQIDRNMRRKKTALETYLKKDKCKKKLQRIVKPGHVAES
jgi:hypothetical protein